MMGLLPSESLMRDKSWCLLSTSFPFCSTARLLTSRCASRGENLREEWRTLQGSTNVQGILKRLNAIIRGWANYFRTAVASHTFYSLDHWMWQRQVRYTKRKHPNKPWRWKKSR